MKMQIFNLCCIIMKSSMLSCATKSLDSKSMQYHIIRFQPIYTYNPYSKLQYMIYLPIFKFISTSKTDGETDRNTESKTEIQTNIYVYIYFYNKYLIVRKWCASPV